MHLMQDENGNLVPHGHEHEHAHTHTYEHTHPHSHERGQEETHTHCHNQEHDEVHCRGKEHDGCSTCGAHMHSPAQEVPSGDKMAAVLDYMLKHNEHHAAELDQVAEKLRAEGKEAAAEQIKKAVDEFQKGNLYLSLALSMVKTN